jgi:hypothetical protein
MFINDQDNHNIRNVHILNPEEKALAKAFIQGAVYGWLNRHAKGDEFSVRILFGGDNTDWEGTPLQQIWDSHKANGKTNDEAHEQSAKDVGWLLKSVLAEDTTRKFNKIEGFTNTYCWID